MKDFAVIGGRLHAEPHQLYMLNLRASTQASIILMLKQGVQWTGPVLNGLCIISKQKRGYLACQSKACHALCSNLSGTSV